MEVRDYLRAVIKGSKKKSKGKEDGLSASDELENILNAIQRAAEGEEDGNAAEIDLLIDGSPKCTDVPKPPTKRVNPPKSAAKKAKAKRGKRAKESDDDTDEEENANHPKSMPEKRGQARFVRKAALRKIVNSVVLDEDVEED